MNRDYVISVIAKARDEVSNVLRGIGDATDSVRRSFRDLDNDSNSLSRTMRRLAGEGDRTNTSLSRLGNLRFVGFAIAIKYSQALLSALVALGGELVAVASSAIFAAGALGSGLAIGIAQGLPVIGLLIGAFTRVSAVMEAVKAKTALADAAQQNQTRTQDQQRQSAEALRAAQERIVDAEEQVKLATEGVTDARRAARLELEDLTLAEKDAELAASRAHISLREAEARLRELLATPGATGMDIRSAELDVREARQGVRRADVEEGRTSHDLRRAERQGIERMDVMVEATRSLEDAEDALRDAVRDRGRVQRDAAEAMKEQNSQALALETALGKLSGAERELYDAINSIKETAKETLQPISDILVGSFATGVERTEQLIRNPAFLQPLTLLADRTSAALDSITERTLIDEGFVDDFGKIMEQSAKNVEPLADAWLRMTRAFMNFVIAGGPFFHELVMEFREWAGELREASRDTDSLRNFFDEGLKQLRAWWHLLGSILNLFAAIVGPGGAAQQGRKDIEELADVFNGWANDIRTNRAEVRGFFKDASDGTKAVLSILPALGRELSESFDVRAIEVMSQTVREIFVPALGTIIRVVGAVMRVTHTFLNLPLVSEFAMWALAAVGIVRVFAVIRLAVTALASTLSPLLIIFAAIATAITVLSGNADGLAQKWADLKRWFDELSSAAKIAMAAFAGFMAVLAVGRIAAAVRAAGGLAAAIRAIGLAFAATPFGVIAAGIGIVVSALGLFGSEEEQAKTKAEDLTTALRDQAAAMREVRDIALEEKDRKLALRSAENSLLMAQRERNRVAKEYGRDSIEYEQADIAVAQARQQVKHTTLEVNRYEKDRVNVLKDAVTTSRDAAEQGRARLDTIFSEASALRDDIDQQKAYIQTLKDQGVSGKNLKDEVEQLRDMQGEYNDTMRRYNAVRERVIDADQRGERATDSLRRSQGKTEEVFRHSRGTMANFIAIMSGVSSGLAEMVNKGLKALGADTLDWDGKIGSAVVRGASTLGSSLLGAVAATGFPGAQRGAIMPGYSKEDELLVKVRRGEAMLEPDVQQPIVDSSLRMTHGMSLAELIRKTGGAVGGQSFARGGYTGPGHSGAGFTPIWNLARDFGMTYYTGFDGHSQFTSSGNVSDHWLHRALDMGNGILTRQEDALNAFFKNKVPQIVKQLIWRNVDQFQGFSIPGHEDHIHLAMPDAYAFNAPVTAKILSAAQKGLDISKLLVAGAAEDLGGMDAALWENIPPVKISGPGGPMRRMLQGASDKIRSAANKYGMKQASKFGGGLLGAAGGAAVGALHGSLDKREMRRLLDAVGLPDIFYWIANAESGFNPNATNPSGASGLFQIMMPLHAAIVDRFGGDVFDPLTNAKVAKVLYTQSGTTPWNPSIHGWGSHVGNPSFAQGGELPGPIGQAFPIVAHGKEWILNTMQQMKLASLAGVSRDRLRDLLGFRGGPKSYAGGGEPGRNVQRQFERQFDEILDEASLEDIRRALRKGQKSAFLQRLMSILKDGGLLDQFTEQMDQAFQRVESIVATAGIHVRRNGRIIDRMLTPTQRIRIELTALRQELDKLLGTRSTLRKAMRQTRKALGDVNDELEENAKDMKGAEGKEKRDLKKEREDLKKRRERMRTSLEELGDRAAELGESIRNMAEEIIAQELALFQARIDEVTQRGDFKQSIIDAGMQMLQTLGEITGVYNTELAQQMHAQIGQQLSATGQRLRQLLAELIGLGGAATAQLMGASGLDLYNFIQGLTSGGQLQAIFDSLSTEQEAQFMELIDAILANENALLDNTLAVQELTGRETQMANSTAWELFRLAIFSGSGGLLPGMEVPSLQGGGRLLTDGLVYGHAAEVMKPAHDDDGAKEVHVHVTEPMEVADPMVLANEFMWRMSRERYTAR